MGPDPRARPLTTAASQSGCYAMKMRERRVGAPAASTTTTSGRVAASCGSDRTAIWKEDSQLNALGAQEWPPAPGMWRGADRRGVEHMSVSIAPTVPMTAALSCNLTPHANGSNTATACWDAPRSSGGE
ncbi:hypothetical protein AAFF_G00130740 [Aldrovandia affinis]|uniref:Uncharacterized protein n=1 Tax=Aldrovandia affinis TaxID=143900 RepID=A0AAD7W9R3_9TELE|nr:hypothetical protein AAFF_G00130740 [Aldrovandia affinis]